MTTINQKVVSNNTVANTTSSTPYPGTLIEYLDYTPAEAKAAYKEAKEFAEAERLRQQQKQFRPNKTTSYTSSSNVFDQYIK